MSNVTVLKVDLRRTIKILRIIVVFLIATPKNPFEEGS